MKSIEAEAKIKALEARIKELEQKEGQSDLQPGSMVLMPEIADIIWRSFKEAGIKPEKNDQYQLMKAVMKLVSQTK